MIKGECKVFEFSAHYKENRPQGDLDQVRHESECDRQHNN
jgi:hypothetical protein